jgi:hypothetical protein
MNNPTSAQTSGTVTNTSQYTSNQPRVVTSTTHNLVVSGLDNANGPITLSSEHPHNRPVIVLDRDYFEHLLNCLANQKFIYHVNADGLSEGEEKVKQMQSEAQQAIDDAWRKGMDMLYKSTKEEVTHE